MRYFSKKFFLGIVPMLCVASAMEDQVSSDVLFQQYNTMSEKYFAEELKNKDSIKELLDIRDEDLEKAFQLRAEIRVVSEVYKNQIREVSNLSKGKSVIVVVGSTGAGKSTLLNLIAGNELKASDSGYVLGKTNHKVFEIGSGSNSQTLFPQVLEMSDGVFCDIPGFNDTRGGGINFLNGLFTKQIFQTAKDVKFVFVLPMTGFEYEKGQAIKDLMLHFSKIFVGSNIKESTINVISYSQTNNKSDLLKLIKKKIGEEEMGNIQGVVGNKYIPFLDYRKFLDDDLDGNGTATFDQVKLMRVLQRFEDEFMKDLNELSFVKVPSFEPSYLLKQEVARDIANIVKIKAMLVSQKYLYKDLPKEICNIKKFKEDFVPKIEKDFKDNFEGDDVIKKIKDFDEFLYLKEYEYVLSSVLCNHLKIFEDKLDLEVQKKLSELKGKISAHTTSLDINKKDIETKNDEITKLNKKKGCCCNGETNKKITKLGTEVNQLTTKNDEMMKQVAGFGKEYEKITGLEFKDCKEYQIAKKIYKDARNMIHDIRNMGIARIAANQIALALFATFNPVGHYKQMAHEKISELEGERKLAQLLGDEEDIKKINAELEALRSYSGGLQACNIF